MSSLHCWAFAWLNDCANGDEADFTYVQTHTHTHTHTKRKVSNIINHSQSHKMFNNQMFGILLRSSITFTKPEYLFPNHVTKGPVSSRCITVLILQGNDTTIYITTVKRFRLAPMTWDMTNQWGIVQFMRRNTMHTKNFQYLNGA